MLLNLFTLNNNNQPAFGYGIPKRSFNDVRDIPGLTCAKCGKKMMSLLERDELINKLLAGSKTCLQRHEFDEFRNSNNFRFLVNLSKKHPKTPLYAIVQDKDVKYKISRMGNFGRKEINEVVDISRTVTRKAPQVIKKLLPFKDRMSPEFQELLDYMEIYAIKYPKCTFSEIFSKREVFDYHDKIRLFRKEEFSLLKTKALKNLDKTAELLPAEQREQFLNLNKAANRIITTGNHPESAKRIMLEVLYKDFLTNITDKKLSAKIQKQINNLPVREISGDNLIVGYSKLNDTEILRMILDNICSTFEHIVPNSEGGKAVKHNGICLCAQCNSERATIAYSVIMEKFPEFAANLQKQLNKIMVFIRHDKLSGYDLYPQRVKKTLLDVTDQKLRINIKKFLKFKEKEAELRFQHAKARYAQNKNLLQETNSEISNNNKKIDELRRELKRLQEEKTILQNKRELHKARVNDSERIMRNAKSSYKSMRKTLNNDK